MDRETVITHLQLIHTWAASARECDLQFFTAKLLEDIAQWTGDAIALLKEQETVEPKTGHWIFESAYCEAWSHTCSECGKRMTTAYNTYANYCWNCGAKMEGR